MLRVHKGLLLGLASIVSLKAGQIQLGIGSNGLTAGYMNPTYNLSTNPTPANSSSCVGAAQNGAGSCYVPSGGVLNKSAYQPNLFSGATVPPANTLQVQGPSTLSAGGATFSKIADPNNPTLNAWVTSAPATGASADIVVSVGLYGVDKIWTMLNDYWGADGITNTTVVFNFGSSSNTIDPLKTETIALVNGQQIRASLNSGGTAKTCLASYTTTCAPANVGATIATTLGAATTIGHATVSAGNVYSTAYGTAPGSGGQRQYAGTSGTVNLDYQLFDFGTWHATDYLVSIVIKNQLASSQVITPPGGGTLSATNQTRAALTAITVNQIDAVATPEPSTVLLSLAGLGALGYLRRRKA